MENRIDSHIPERFTSWEKWKARLERRGETSIEKKCKAYLNSTSLLENMTTNLTTEGKAALIDREGKILARHRQGRAKNLFPHHH